MKNPISNARISFSPIFLRIVKENHKKVLRIDTQLKKLMKGLTKISGEDQTIVTEKKVLLLETELAKASIIVIIFSVMILESYIYDYAARHLTDAFVKEHLERLDTFSKWIKVPLLITGKELPHHQEWRELLKRLIRARNTIIHHKSSQPPTKLQDTKRYLEELRTNSESLLTIAKQSTQLLDILANKIIDIDPQESAWVKTYLI